MDKRIMPPADPMEAAIAAGVEVEPRRDDVEGEGQTPDGSDSQVQGEGDYVSARKYQKHQHQFAENEGLVNRKGREAADALDGPEGEELEEARAASQRGRTV